MAKGRRLSVRAATLATPNSIVLHLPVRHQNTVIAHRSAITLNRNRAVDGRLRLSSRLQRRPSTPPSSTQPLPPDLLRQGLNTATNSSLESGHFFSVNRTSSNYTASNYTLHNDFDCYNTISPAVWSKAMKSIFQCRGRPTPSVVPMSGVRHFSSCRPSKAGRGTVRKRLEVGTEKRRKTLCTTLPHMHNHLPPAPSLRRM